MLEFNIDKQAGIKLHTCERKSRWCKTLLLFSWLLLLPLLLGWLFWQGFLSLDNNINRNVNNNANIAATKKPRPIVGTATSSLDCSAEVETSVATSVAISIKESKAKCDKQLGRLENELITEINDVKNTQLKGDGELSQQLVDANQKLKTAQEALRNSEQEVKTMKTASSVPATDSSVGKALIKKLYFYEKILAVNGNKNAIAIENFAIKSQDKERHFRFQLLLTKLGKHQTTTGSYDIFIKGNKITELKDSDEVSISGDKSISISDRQLVKKQSVTYKHTGLLPAENVATDSHFSFEYYQDLQGDIVLPEHFEVDSFSVIIHPKNLSTVRNSYEWKKVQNQPFKEVL